MTHTPGPWQCHQGWPSDVWHVDMPDRKFSVVVSRHDEDYDMPVEEVADNARLMAAAPEMLKTLRFVLPTLKRAAREQPLRDAMGINLLLEAQEEVQRAIRIAEGQVTT